jgi:iron(III) transport system ATP-binding protein
LVREIASLLRDEGLSALYVTHDQGEAFAVADRIAVMAGGRVLQDATPEALVARPASAEVAQFLNLGAIVAGDVAGGVFRHAASGLALRADAADGPAEALLPRRAPRADPVGPILAEIAEQRFRGDDVLVTARLPDGAVLSFAHPQRLPGGGVRLSLDPAAVTVFAAASARPVLTPIPEEA